MQWKYRLHSHIDAMNNSKGCMHILMLILNGMVGINFENPIIQRQLLSLKLENWASWSVARVDNCCR